LEEAAEVLKIILWGENKSLGWRANGIHSSLETIFTGYRTRQSVGEGLMGTTELNKTNFLE